MTLIPIQKTTVTAAVKFNPAVLTTNSGAALLEDSVRAAAGSACDAATALSPDQISLGDQSCVLRAMQSAQPQVAAAIARARSKAKG